MHLYTKNVQALRSERFSWMADGLAFSGLLMIVTQLSSSIKRRQISEFLCSFSNYRNSARNHLRDIQNDCRQSSWLACCSLELVW